MKKLIFILMAVCCVNEGVIAGLLHEAVRTRNTTAIEELLTDHPSYNLAELASQMNFPELTSNAELDAGSLPPHNSEDADDELIIDEEFASEEEQPLMHRITPIWLAIELGYDDVVRYLINYCNSEGLNPIETLGLHIDNGYITPIFAIVCDRYSGDLGARLHILEMLMDLDIRLVVPIDYNTFIASNLFFYAIAKGDVQLALGLLDYCERRGLNPIEVLRLNDVDDTNRRVLHYVADYKLGDDDDYVRLTNRLLRLGISALEIDNGYDTALHIAVFNNHTGVVMELLEGEEDRLQLVNAFDGNDQAALHIAIRRGNVGMVRILVDRGADVMLDDGDAINPLELAADNEAIRGILLDHIAAQDDRGETTVPVTEVEMSVNDSVVRSVDMLQMADEVLRNNTKEYGVWGDVDGGK